MNGMSELRLKNAEATSSFNSYFESELAESLALIRETKGPLDHAQQQRIDESLQTVAKNLERYAHTMKRALNRVHEITEVKISKVSKQVEQADSRIKDCFERHAHTIELLRARRLSPKSLAEKELR